MSPGHAALDLVLELNALVERHPALRVIIQSNAAAVELFARGRGIAIAANAGGSMGTWRPTSAEVGWCNACRAYHDLERGTKHYPVKVTLGELAP